MLRIVLPPPPTLTLSLTLSRTLTPTARLRDVAHPPDPVVLRLLAGGEAPENRANAHAKEADEDEHLVRVRVS